MTSSISRRKFLKQSGAMSTVGLTGGSWLANLAALGNASAAGSQSGYKALVCIFLYGANDGFNTVLPLDTLSWNEYSRRRINTPGNASDVSLVLPQDTLQKVTPLNTNVEIGLHPSLVRTRELFNAGSLAIMANVGPLVAPTTRADYKAGLKRPPGLFSHNDQQTLWQSGQSNVDTSGWGGRMMERVPAGGVLSSLLSINTGSNTPFVSGDALNPYNLTRTPSGAVRIGAKADDATPDQLYGGISRQYLIDLVEGRQGGKLVASNGGQVLANLLERDHAGVVRRSTTAETYLASHMPAVTLSSAVTRPTTPMINELEAIARMIKLQALSEAPNGRQVFFVGFGGFDTHDNQIPQQANLLKSVDNALFYFQSILNAEGLAQNVTTFTASEFGRKLSSNGDGTDHGWGNHHFVMGGAVAGQKLYGQMPSYAPTAPGSADSFVDTNMLDGDGVMLPVISTDQYASTLGKWFGNFTDEQIKSIFPKHFGPTDLGFFKPAV